MANNKLDVARIKLSTIQYYLDLIQKDWTIDMLKDIMEFDKAQMKGIAEARAGETLIKTPATLPIFDVMPSAIEWWNNLQEEDRQRRLSNRFAALRTNRSWTYKDVEDMYKVQHKIKH